jgi:hypothetical protein
VISPKYVLALKIKKVRGIMNVTAKINVDILTNNNLFFKYLSNILLRLKVDITKIMAIAILNKKF